MSVLVYIENHNGKIKKSGYETATYGAKLAKAMNTESIALVIGKAENTGDLGKYGITRVLHANSNDDSHFFSHTYTSAIAKVAEENNADVVVLSHSADGKSLTGRLAVRLNAGCVSGANSLPDISSGFRINKGVYSGKAIATYEITTHKKVISVMGNTLKPEIVGEAVTPEDINLDVACTKMQIVKTQTSEGHVPLPEAELVVSAGRGMKGPENWGIIENLADVLGATTACSRPVADSGWRPHHEHVGQTGIAIHPNLYIAIGISGAIQHLAGVNNSKVIVVINKDSEAPFFKAADYGVVGDLFEVVPKLTEAIKKLKQN